VFHGFTKLAVVHLNSAFSLPSILHGSSSFNGRFLWKPLSFYIFCPSVSRLASQQLLNMFYGAFRCGVLLAFAGQLWLGPSAAHIVMAQPPSINYKANPNTAVENYDYTTPLSSSGSDFPCKGELKYLGSKAGASVANYAPGGAFTIK
jgi:hypothetical protein